MFLMGSDFHYSNARLWCVRCRLQPCVRVLFCDTGARRYQNLDKIIDLVNADGRVTAFYSNPIMYISTPSIKADFAH